MILGVYINSLPTRRAPRIRRCSGRQGMDHYNVLLPRPEPFALRVTLLRALAPAAVTATPLVLAVFSRRWGGSISTSSIFNVAGDPLTAFKTPARHSPSV